ncbi:PREDICTED: tctex1 domain-containing protein 1-like [Vollenhovia emeryi]|uniref:tctex1 domain-containing protein 1-like n=1 Tax=Vollenhovia emeryi TaxID=411798 RepID=UPI0005F5011A|nr:PREDICTED: tctex1 domain-containing protein 1-like [Vollenhovia emeryi]
MGARQQSVPRAWSAVERAIRRSKTRTSSPQSIAGIPKSLFFRIEKGGFKVPKYQNTYRLEAYKPFKCEVVDLILIGVMQEYLASLKYHPQICMQICQRMSEEVRDKICRKFYDRYKVVVVMSIVQKLGQGVRIDFSKLWDVQRDAYSTHVIETAEYFAIGLVVGTYYE